MLFLLLTLGLALPPADTDFFEQKIRPVLVAKCASCHSAENSGVRARGVILRGHELLTPTGGAELLRMLSKPHPTGKDAVALEPHQVRAFETWLRAGAVWPEAEESSPRRSAKLWSLEPLVEPDLPDLEGHPIDRFLDSKMREAGVQATPAADRETLARRVCFDLTGLPPTRQQLKSFVRDASPFAFQLFVDRLLESRHYGERWGRHWLDLVRYADTAGDAADFPVPEAYRYRNYVIDAFNKDKPYDRFVREQIAGDLLPFDNDNQRWEQSIATGYIAISRRIGVSPQNLRHITIEDTLDNLGKTFLALSVGCARCHDHKFDPIPTRDYYALYGIFDSSIYPHAGAEHKPHRENFVYRIGDVLADEALREKRQVLRAWRQKERAQLEVYRSFQRMKVEDSTKTRASTWAELLRIRADLGEFAKTFPKLETAFAIREGEARDAHVMRGGDPSKRSRGELVPRGFLSALGGQRLPDRHRGSGRLELAEWLTQPTNPLTARVIVNRVWRHHFGVGLVSSTSDFGVRGTQPSHPELLDYLALRFMKSGWSFKSLHRFILSSKAYQRSSMDVAKNSEIDPDNRLLWRARRRRLDAEQLRDSLLLLSGELDRSVGGRHPFPHELTYFYRQHEPFQEKYPSKRRSVYLLQRRLEKDPFLDLFDGPDGNLHLADRRESTTALQALYLLNSEFVHERSKAFAERVLKIPVFEERVQFAYGSTFGRYPDPSEIDKARRFLGAEVFNSTKNSEQAERLAWSSYLRSMVSSNEFLFID